jgi:ankyrin repeat protein
MYVHCLFKNGYTALMDAAELGNTVLVEMLVKARARTDLKTKVSPAPIRLELSVRLQFVRFLWVAHLPIVYP